MEDSKVNNANDKKKKRIYIINLIVIIAIFVGLTIYVFSVESIENIRELMRTANYKWAMLGFLCLIGMWVAEAVTLHLPIKKLYPKQKFGNSFKITMIGQLFNNITPFASGGQPMQAYIMHKEGKRTSDSLSILSMKFIITQMTLIVFTIVVVLSQFNFFTKIFKDLVWIGIVRNYT